MLDSFDKSKFLIFSPNSVDPGSLRSFAEKPLAVSHSRSKFI